MVNSIVSTFYIHYGDFLIEQYGEHGISADDLMKQKLLEYKTNDNDLAYEEVVADACERMLVDSNAVEKLMQLQQKDSSIIAKIKEFIQNVLNKVKALYKNLMPDSAEARAVMEMQDVAQKLYDLFEDMAVDAAQNKRMVGQTKNTAENSGVKRMIKVLEDGRMFVSASRNVITGNNVAVWRKQITNFFNDLLEGNKSIDIVAANGDVLTISKKETAQKARDNYKTEKNKRVKLTDNEFFVKLKAEAHIDEIASVSLPNHQEKDNKSHSFAKDGFSYRTAYFEDFDGEYYKITLSIGHDGSVATVYNVGKIDKDSVPSAKLIAVVGSKALGTPSNNSIPNSAQNVKGDVKKSIRKDSQGNRLTEAQAEYFKDSKVRDADGNLKVVYHGSGSEFTTFSYDFMSSHGSSEGQGFYFTDKKTMAEGYQKNGTKLMSGYLDIKKPLSDSEKTLTKAELKRLIRAVDPTGDDVLVNYSDGRGYPSKAWYTNALSETVDSIYDYCDTDSELLADLANSGAGTESVLRTVKNELSYDGYIVSEKYDDATVYVAFESSQFKNLDNENPTSDEDIRYSRKKSIAKGKKKYYNEFNSLAMQWANSAGTAQGDCKRIYNGKRRKWCLVIADENSVGGYTIRKVGTYEEVQKYERLYYGEDAVFDRYVEAYDSNKRRHSGNLRLHRGERELQRDLLGRNSGTSHTEQGAVENNTATTNDEYVLSDNLQTPSGIKAQRRVQSDSVYDLLGMNEELQKRNEALQEDVKRLNELVNLQSRVTHGKVFTQSSVGLAAKKLKTLGKSDIALSELTPLLNEFYSYIAEGNELTWEDVMSRATDIARAVEAHTNTKGLPIRSPFSY